MPLTLCYYAVNCGTIDSTLCSGVLRINFFKELTECRSRQYKEYKQMFEGLSEKKTPHITCKFNFVKGLKSSLSGKITIENKSSYCRKLIAVFVKVVTHHHWDNGARNTTLLLYITGKERYNKEVETRTDEIKVNRLKSGSS